MLFRHEFPRRMAFPDGIKDQQQHILTLPKQNKRHLIHPNHDSAQPCPRWPISDKWSCNMFNPDIQWFTPYALRLMFPPKTDMTLDSWDIPQLENP